MDIHNLRVIGTLTSSGGTVNLSGDSLVTSGDISANKGIFDDIQITTSPTSGYLLTSDSSGNGYWTNPLSAYALTAQLTAYEPVFLKGSITTSPTGIIYLSGNGTDRLVGDGDIELQLTQATSADDGYLSSVDWNIFNDKQSALIFNSPLSEDGSGNVSIELSGYATTDDISAFITTANLTGYVPYTGAVSAVDLSGQTLTTTSTGIFGKIKMTASPTSGYVLTSSDASGNAVWAQPAGGSSTQVATVSFAGPLAIYTGKLRWTPPGTVTLSGATARVTTPSSGADINFTINVTGTALVSSSITTETSGGTEFSLGSTSIGKTDYITVDIDQVGSSTTGSDLVVSIFYTS